jgi:hypothetical protein
LWCSNPSAFFAFLDKILTSFSVQYGTRALKKLPPLFSSLTPLNVINQSIFWATT